MSDLAAPFDGYRDVVRPEWIDHNQHMNMGYYLVVFDFATDEFLRWVGLDEAYRAAHAVTTFCLEAHVTYHREVRRDDPLRFTEVLTEFIETTHPADVEPERWRELLRRGEPAGRALG